MISLYQPFTIHFSMQSQSMSSYMLSKVDYRCLDEQRRISSTAYTIRRRPTERYDRRWRRLLFHVWRQTAYLSVATGEMDCARVVLELGEEWFMRLPAICIRGSINISRRPRALWRRSILREIGRKVASYRKAIDCYSPSKVNGGGEFTAEGRPVLENIFDTS